MARMARAEVFAPDEVAVVQTKTRGTKTRGRDEDSGDTKIILVCRVIKTDDGGAGGGKSISRGTESQVFRGRAAGKRTRTRSSGNKANENPCLVDFSTSEGVVNLPPSDFLGSMLLRRWQ